MTGLLHQRTTSAEPIKAEDSLISARFIDLLFPTATSQPFVRRASLTDLRIPAQWGLGGPSGPGHNFPTR